MTSDAFNFEAAMSELETIVNQLEKGELSLEESLKKFEQGILLVRQCKNLLQQAEQKIEFLSNTEAGDVNNNKL